MTFTTVDDHQIRQDAPCVRRAISFPVWRGPVQYGQTRLGTLFGPGISQPTESAPEHFLHTCIIVDPIHQLDFEPPVMGGFRLTILKYDHATHQAGALNVGDVVTFHTDGQGGQTQLFLQLSHSLVNNIGIVQPLDPVLS